MSPRKIIEDLHRQWRRQAQVDYRKANERFFTEGIKLMGVRSSIVRAVAKEKMKEIRHLNKEDMCLLCEALLKTGWQEDSMTAYQWAASHKKLYEPSDFKTFEGWLMNYVDNWAKCDDLCTRVIGYLLIVYPHLIAKTVEWRRSRSRWVRRGSAVSLIRLARQGSSIKDVLQVAEDLMDDDDDMVQKGYGWTLKEASKKFRQEVFEFVMKNKTQMPRLPLRYAIEKLPEGQRKKVMAK